MHHLYPTVKGDPLCPLGFHPQVRWPTRCKRCFRDYKEHGRKRDDEGSTNLRRDDVTISSPSLSTWNSVSSRNRDDTRSGGVDNSRNWASSTSLSTAKEDNAESAMRVSGNTVSSSSFGTPTSWTSTPDLANLSNNTQANVVSFNIPLPKKRPQPVDTGQQEVTLKRPDLIIKKTDSLAERVKKLQAQKSVKTENTATNTITNRVRNKEREREKEVKKEKEKEKEREKEKEKEKIMETNSNDVQFLIQVKSKTPSRSNDTSSLRRSFISEDGGDTDKDDTTSIADTDTTETTLVGHDAELQEQIESLKQELETVKARCEKAEREKSDILLRRLASYEPTVNKTSASEVLKLQQKVNELQTLNEDLRDEKKSLSLKVKELEEELESRPTSAEAKRIADELQAKLTAAETLCEELMDENEDMKKELRDLEEEIEEMQDNFREDQADEYTSLKKELEQTSKNCRILSFKLRKAERKTEELETNKKELEQKLQEIAGENIINHVERIKYLEHELKLANEVSVRLQKELEDTNDKLLKLEGKQFSAKKKAPPLGNIGKSASTDGRISRETLTRGGSQDDPVQLLRDLQDSLEREADLREQLRFAEEELIRQQKLSKLKLGRSTSDQDPLLKPTTAAIMPTKSQQILSEICENLKTINIVNFSPDVLTMLRHSATAANIKKLKLQPDLNSCLTQTDQLHFSETESQTDTRQFLDNETQIDPIRIGHTETQTENIVKKNFAQQIRISLETKITQTEPLELKHISTMTDSNKQITVETQTQILVQNVYSQTENETENTNPQTQGSFQIPFPFLLPSLQQISMSSMLLPGHLTNPARRSSFMPPLENLRRKTSRIEDDNESLVLQLKKMATKARSRKLSPTSHHLSPESSIDKDEGISDVEDPTELKLLLELNEQEAAVLRRKVEDLEAENDRLNKKVKELHEKKAKTKTSPANLTVPSAETKTSPLDEQKIKVLETEISELRKKLIEKERDCERLHAELTLTQKQRTKGTLVKSKSLDSDQQAIDLKRQLEVIEQEAQVLHSKIKTLEADNEKLAAENKRLQLISGTKKIASDKSLNMYIDKIANLETELAETKKKLKAYEDKSATTGKEPNEVDAMVKKKLKEEVEKLKEQLKKVETEKNTLSDKLTKLKDEAIKIKPRTPKRPTDLTTKLQMKKMVLELEDEISEILVQLKNSEEARKKLESKTDNNVSATSNAEVEKLKKEIDELKTKLTKTEEELNKEKSKATQDKNEVKNVSTKLTEATEKCKTLESKLTQLEQDRNKLQEENTKLSEKIKELNTEIKTAQSKTKDMDKTSTDLKTAKKDLELRDKEIDKLKKDIEKLEKLNQEKTKLSKELEEKNKTISTLEKKAKEVEEKLKDSEKQLSTKKEEIVKLEKTIASKAQTESAQIKQLEEDLKKAQDELNSLNEKFETNKKSKTSLEEDIAKLKTEIKTIQTKNTELENEIKNQKDQNTKMKTNYEKDLKNKDSEISKLESKVKLLDQTSGMRSKKIADVKKEYEEQVAKLKKDIEHEKQEYEDLTAKYELLEEEHVVIKAQLVAEKETLNRQLQETEMGLETVSTELQALRDSYNVAYDAWMQEKLALQEKIKQLEANSSNDTLAIERNRFKNTLDEKQKEIEQARKECEVVKDQLDFARRENDELKKKLDDFDKVSKIQRTMSADTTALEKEIRQLTNRCNNAEKMHKIEMTQTKMRYDNQVAVLNEELQSLQNQVTRFKRERDNYKHMLESAQRTMSELKTTGKRGSVDKALVNNFDENEETRTKIATLEQQISCLEDELSEARLESSKLKTELVSERSSWEIKLSEMQTRMNELEEERIISSGRSKIPGLKTKMELAWQKEREELQRLLQETSTLARDLRQTLFEVERERDKERLEAKRKQEQLKKFVDEEHEENKKKLNEVQCDLLELRDAHAKLRTTNEKLRREKERYEREHEEMRNAVLTKRRADLEEDRKLSILLEQVEELIKLVPELSNQDSDSNSLLAMTPTAPRRTKSSKSRESSPAMDRRSMSKEPSPTPRRSDKQGQIQSTLQRLTEATEELRRYQRLGEAEREKERTKRLNVRRAASTETENPSETNKPTNLVPKKGSLKRRSLSLEQTSGNRQDQAIWKNNDDDSLSSLQSLDGKATANAGKYLKRDSSLDSRLSGGSTQSEILGGQKKKKSFIGKLKSLTKSHSIDDSMESVRGDSSQRQGSDSDISISEDVRSSKKDLKGRLTGIFRRGGSSSRSNSLERTRKEPTPEGSTSSLQRPLTSSRSVTPARTDESVTSTASKNVTKVKKK